MKVTFLTRRKDHQLNNNPLITVMEPHQYEVLTALLTKNTENSTSRQNSTIKGYNDWYVLAVDIENRGKPEDGGELLLSAFCNVNEEVLVIDNTSVNNLEIFSREVLQRCFFIAHNADFEAKWGLVTGFTPGRYGCTMVNDRRLLSGQQGYHFDLVSVINRRLGFKAIPQWMDKDIRNQFATCTFFTDEQILYNAADTIRLKDVYRIQLEEAEKLNQSFLHRTLNSRIIIPIAEAEVTGIKHDSEKWINIAKGRKEKADNICKELNQIVQSTPGIEIGKINPQVRKQQESQEKRLKRNQERKLKLEQQLKQLEEKNKTHLKSYRVSQEQLSTCVQLVESLKTQNVNVLESIINWSSPKQVLEVFRQMSIPLPLAKDQKTRKLKPKLSKEARTNWFLQHEETPWNDFMKRFDNFKKTEHNIKSFGEKWVEQYVRNGRAYTSFDQAGTATGRHTSGSKGLKKEYCNISQIPGSKDYRSCFVSDDGRLFFTGDYKNQEGLIIISLSGDMEMKKITESSDQHSLLGTEAWRAVYKHRYERTGDQKWLELSQSYEMNQSTEEKKKERSKFKNSAGLFPILYGSRAAKVSATAGVSLDEAEIMLQVIKSHAPQAVLYLDSKAKEGSTNGYVVHNEVTNSRRWFSPVLENIKYGFPISKSDTIEVEQESRNSSIQGTGSDIMKLAIAMIACWNTIYKQDIRFVLSNYDEYVASFPIEKQEQYTKVVVEFMKRAAKRFLIKDLVMEVEHTCLPYWNK